MNRYKIRLFVLIVSLLICCPGLRAVQRWEVIHSGELRWNLLLADLEKATSYICLQTFIISDDESGRAVVDVLTRKAAEGVKVRMLFDDLGCAYERKPFFLKMMKTQAEVRFISDLRRWDALSEINIRNHRKIVVIDGKIGYLGGMNMNDSYHYDWKDTDARIEGPAVGELERIFFQAWTRVGGTGPAVPSAVPAPDDPVEILAGGPAYPTFVNFFLRSLREALTYIYIQTPYFCPPDTLVTAMKEAAARGVDVRLLLPVKTDLWYMTAANRSFYPDLLEGGIRVFEYLPCFVHSKTFSCDDRICWVSSVNLDNRSLYLSYEVGACFRDEGTAAAEKRWFLGMLEDSREITLQETESWSKARRLKYRLPLLLKHQL